jgi:hypothetical protein
MMLVIDVVEICDVENVVELKKEGPDDEVQGEKGDVDGKDPTRHSAHCEFHDLGRQCTKSSRWRGTIDTMNRGGDSEREADSLLRISLFSS